MRVPTIRSNREFRAVYALKRSSADSLLVSYRQSAAGPVARYGVSVSRKVGKAVVRNRIKRRIKEILRTNMGSCPAGCDIIFVVRPACAAAGFDELEHSVLKLLARRF